LYANFAGYMDIVIGIGGLLGHSLPENFDRPFLARNFLELWTRWHITLSQWFRTYVFNPLLQLLATRVTSARLAPYLAVVVFFVTFLLMGVWHGATSVFVLYGLFMGAGASVNKLWQQLASKRLGKARYKAWCEKPGVAYASRGLTFAYFAFGLSCLWLNLGELLALAHRLGAAGILLGYLSTSVAAAIAFRGWDLLAAGVERVRSAAWNEPGLIARNLGLGLLIVLIVSVSSFFHKAPEFVYRAF
jgi:D-alanyl-lipoteichoic acid acyltransferase DltB (MBOAT superfamily)